jgi:hypothetical protein
MAEAKAKVLALVSEGMPVQRAMTHLGKNQILSVYGFPETSSLLKIWQTPKTALKRTP